MIDKTLLYRELMTTYSSFCARLRAEAFSSHDLRSHDKHEEIEHNFMNMTTDAFSRTIHERNLRSRLRKAFYEHGTFAIYEHDYEVSLTFVPRTWVYEHDYGKIFYRGFTNVVTFLTTYSMELNESHGLRSPFNSHERGLETEHGTNVERAVTTGCSQGTTLFYHSFYSLMFDGWMFFRISPWESLTEKSYVVMIRSFPFSLSIWGTILQMPYVVTNVG